MITGKSLLNKRISSAPLNRLNSRTAYNNNSPEPENDLSLYRQLEECSQQLVQAQEQIQYLVHLVRNAWLGDEAAIKHVTRIIGVAIPNIQPIFSGQQHTGWSVTPQPTAVNNWTKLAVGMLNADAEMTQQVRRAEQNQHLARREAYLDGLIAANYGGGAETWKVPQKSLARRPPSGVRKQQQQQQPLGGRSVLTGGQGQGQGSYVMPGQTLGTRKAQNVQNLCFRPVDQAAGDVLPDNEKAGMPLGLDHLAYDDPERYHQNRLFDASTILGAVGGKVKPSSRPSSGVRPKSGARKMSQGQAMKHTKNSKENLSTEPPLQHHLQSPPSSALRRHSVDSNTASQTHNYNQSNFGHSDDENGDDLDNDIDSMLPAPPSVSFSVSKPSLSAVGNTSPELQQQQARHGVTITTAIADKKGGGRKAVGESFIAGEMQMNKMEEDFKDSVVSLQKKLGVSDSGLVW